jgi:hypothetical protein
MDQVQIAALNRAVGKAVLRFQISLLGIEILTI